jgi:formylglycine-generating enzyme required for sulfatase activity
MKLLFRIFLILPFLGFSQSVLDGVYVKQPSVQEADFKESAIKIGGELVIVSYREKFKKKVIKVNGFQFVNTANYIPTTIDERTEPTPALKNYIYTLSEENLIGIQNHGEVKALQNALIRKTNKFYFKRGEVTNAEYREFISYVFDSLSLNLLANEEPERFFLNEGEENQRLNWEPYDDSFHENEDYTELFSQLYYGENDERFYKKSQIDARKFNYEYWDKDSIRRVINIYPDTLTWVHNLSTEFVEPMSQMYFWHPVYDDYPIVGVSHKQAQAYLNWRFSKGFKELDKKGIKYEIGLPTHEEWEFTASLLCTQNKKQKEVSTPKYYEEFLDKNMSLDLILTRHPKFKLHASNDNDLTYYKSHGNFIRTQFKNPYFFHFKNIPINQWDITAPSELANKDIDGLHSINNQVFHLGSNVSEWLEAPYNEYKDFFRLKAKTLSLSNYQTPALIGKKLQEKQEKYSDSHRMIIGANWMDCHDEMYFGVPLKGLYAKTFSSVDSSYSTVGFRYVIRISNDQKKRRNLDFEPLKTINIFEELKKAGFELKQDSTSKMVQKIICFNPHKKKEITQQETSVLGGIYRRYIPGDENSYSILIEEFPELLKVIEKNGGRTYSFYSTVPNQPKNIVTEFRLKAVNKYTFELIQW